MNRKKKINKIFTKKAKQARAKNNPNSKPRYISKADRAAAEQQPVDDANTSTLTDQQGKQ